MQTGAIAGTGHRRVPIAIDNILGAYVVSGQPPDVSGFVFKGSADPNYQGLAYNRGQAFEVLRPGASGDATDTGMAGAGLLRITADGALGMAGNLHIPTGLRQPAGYSSTFAVWIQPYVNTTHVVMTGYSAQSSNFITATNSGGASLFSVSSNGSILSDALTDKTGTGPYFFLSTAYLSVIDRVVSGAEAFPMLVFASGATRTGTAFQCTTGNAGASAVGVYAAASQTADVVFVANSALTKVAAITAAGSLRVAAGSNTLPAVANLAETGTGIYFTAGNIGLSINGVLKSYQSATFLNLISGVGLSMGAADIATDTTTGTSLATGTTQKTGMHGARVVQRAGAAQVAVATTAATNVTPYGFTTAAQADAIVTLLNELRAANVEKGLIKGAA